MNPTVKNAVWMFAMLAITAAVPAFSADTNFNFDQGINVKTVLAGIQANNDSSPVPAVTAQFTEESRPTARQNVLSADPSKNVLLVVGVIGNTQLSCRLENNNMSCDLPITRDGTDFNLARAVYLDRMAMAWGTTHDIRNACPGTTDYQCISHETYACTHTVVPQQHCETHSCTEASGSTYCHAGQTEYQECHSVDACHVACNPNGGTC